MFKHTYINFINLSKHLADGETNPFTVWGHLKSQGEIKRFRPRFYNGYVTET